MASLQAANGNIHAMSEIMKKLSISDINTMTENFSGGHTFKASCAERMNPLAYFSTTFKHPATLMSAMFDSGCLLSGLRALEFFIPGSAQPDANWDFYVSGYKESVADMVNALSICGVTWNLYGQDILDDLRKKGSAVVSRRRMMALNTWAQEKTTYLLGEQLHSILRQFNMKFNTNELISNSFTIELQPDGRIDIIPGGETHFQDLPHKDPFGQPFSILHGTIATARGTEKVQLIIGFWYKGIMEYIRTFHASHLQAFIGGWCAAHMYYQQASVNQSILWDTTTDRNGSSSKPLIEQHPNNKGYTFLTANNFMKANPSIVRVRTFVDRESLVLDYGDLYYSLISPQNHKMLDLWLSNRRKNMQSIEWVESRGKILRINSPWNELYHNCERFFITDMWELPDHHRQRLANMVALGTQRPNAMRSNGFHSSVGSNVMRQGWQMIVLARSGTVFCELKDATPWSWVL